MSDTELSPSLMREGDLMLGALTSDLCALPGVQCVITRDARLPAPRLPADCRDVHHPEQFHAVWADALACADAVWPIAPEHGRRLERITETILDAGKILLNSRPGAVGVTASKLQTLRLLEDAGIAVVPTFGRDDVLPDIKGCWVLKPDDGVGCLGIRVFRDRDALCRAWDGLVDGCTHVAQPFMPGTPASLSLLASGGRALLLSVNRQRVALLNDAPVLLGCMVNAFDAGDPRFLRLAEGVAAALPGLWGYLGVDLMIGEDGLRVLEVNPRLTTSYAGLKDALGINAAGMVLDLESGRWPSRPDTDGGRVVEICLEYAGVA